MPSRERHGGAIAGNESFDLGVIEDHADGLVAEQAAARFGDARGDEVAGDVHQLRLGAGRLGRQAVPLVPAHHLVAGDVEGVPDRLLARQQSHQTLGEIAVVGDDPERRAVAGNNHLFAAAHAVHRGVGLRPTVHRQRDLRFAIGSDGRTMVMGKPSSRYARMSRSSQAIFCCEYSQYGLASGVDSVIR